MLEIIAIYIVIAATLFGLPLWLSCIAGKEQDHPNTDIYEEESSCAWALDEREKYTNVDATNRRPDLRDMLKIQRSASGSVGCRRL